MQIKLTQSHSQNEIEIEQSAQDHCKVVQQTKIPALYQKSLQSVHLSHHSDKLLHKSKEYSDQAQGMNNIHRPMIQVLGCNMVVIG